MRKLVFLLCILLWPGLATAGLNEAEAAYKKRNYKVAIKEFQQLAAQGNASAQSWLGDAYEYGKGVPQDYTQAMAWYRQAAEQGDVRAQSWLGVAYEYGKGVPQDYAQAMAWYLKAAEQGDTRAQSWLGGAYENGTGVPQDYSLALEWYRKAAEQGDFSAQTSLGMMYFQGQGVLQDLVQAHMWLSLAVASKFQKVMETFKDKNKGNIIELRQRVAAQMTASQLEEAQRLAREWTAKHGRQNKTIMELLKRKQKK